MLQLEILIVCGQVVVGVVCRLWDGWQFPWLDFSVLLFFGGYPLVEQFKKANLWLALLVILLAVLCFVPGLGGGFIFDDRANIEQNTALHIDRLDGERLLHAAYSFQPGNGSRSLSMLSFALDYWRGGLDAATFKTTNLLIHALTALALVLFLRRLLMLLQWSRYHAEMGAVLLAGLWAVHPLQVSSVLYVVQRMQTLVTLFMVLSMWAYLAMRQAQMEGRRSRQYGVLVLLFWVLGLASKEDAALFPLYTLALELTVLGFAGTSQRLTAAWRRGYLLLVLAGVVVYALVLVPHYWQWGVYPGRDFSSYERLLTQGRVLVMYIGQMLLPLPSRLPFFYDDLVVSRGLLQPISTLLALVLLAGLLIWAWCWRRRRPLFAFGVLLFFAGHFMTSNVLNLELAFEHRNHLPLIGVLLAVADLCVGLFQRLTLRLRAAVSVMMIVLVAAGAGTVWRAHIWGSPLLFAAHTLQLAPHSERAWLMLGGVYADKSRYEAGNLWLDRAIDTNARGGRLTGSAVMLSNVVIYKTIRGDVACGDWEELLARFPQVPMNVQNKSIVFSILENAQNGMSLDEKGVVRIMRVAVDRGGFTSNQYLQMAAYVHNKSQHPEEAFPFLHKAVLVSPADDPEIIDVFKQLSAAGREDWVRQLQEIEDSKGQAAGAERGG